MNVRATSMVLVALTLGLPASAQAQDAGSEDPAPEGESEKPEEPSAETQDDEGPSDLTTGAVPIEDPTLRASTDQEPADDAATTEQQPPAESADETAEEADGGSNVKVAYDRGFLLSVDDWFFLTLGGLVQARYTVSYRTDPPTDPDTLERDKPVTQGFDLARGRFTLGIGLTEFVALVMRIGVVAGGNFEFQRAFIDLKWKFLRLRAGLFMQELYAESFINPHDLLFLDYSIVSNVYSPGSSAGIMFTYLRRRFSINLGYSNGLRTGFSEIRDPAKADFAVTLRAQYAWGTTGLAGFNRLNVRRATPFGVRLAVAAHYQDGGRSGQSLPVKIALFTADLVMRGNGWSATLMAAVGQDSTDPTASNEAGEVVTSGVSLMGGYFVLENLEVFAQYGIVTKPKIQGDLPSNLTDELSEPSNFQSFGVGFSYWIIRGHDNVKVSSDFQYFLGREAGSIVPASPLNSIQPNDAGSQFAWRIQLSAHF